MIGTVLIKVTVSVQARNGDVSVTTQTGFKTFIQKTYYQYFDVAYFTGCILPLVFSDWLRSYRHARFLLVLVGALAQIIGYIIAMLILPQDAVYGNTNNQGPFPPK